MKRLRGNPLQAGRLEGWKSGSRNAHCGLLAPAVTKLCSKAADEKGQSLLLQATLWAFMLTLIIGLVYDLGAVAVAQVQAQDAADLAVQEAAKALNATDFGATQEVRLSPAAVNLARARLVEYSGGRVTLTHLAVVHPDARHWALQLDGEVRVKMRFLAWIGIPKITRQVHARAIPAFGVEMEGE